MNLAAIIAMICHLAPTAVLTAEKTYGDAKSGADKKVVAKDILDGATAGALSVLTGDNAEYAQDASDAANIALRAAVRLTRTTGAYQAATAQAKAKQLPAPAAPAVDTQPVEDIHGIAG